MSETNTNENIVDLRKRYKEENIEFGECEGEARDDKEDETASGPSVSAKKHQLDTWKEIRKKIHNVKWLWGGWLPDHLLTVIAGRSGEGKSALALRIAGCFGSIREKWPDDTTFQGEPKRTLWCETEAGLSIHVKRVEEWGYNLDDFVFPLDDPLADVQLDNEKHWEKIMEKAKRDDIGLIIVDSLRGGHSQNEDSSAIMTDITKRLARLAQKTKKPVLVTHHRRKLSKFDRATLDIDSLRGSTAIVQFARVIWMVDVPNHFHPDQKRLSVIKNNIGPLLDPIGFSIEEDGIVFGDAPEKPKKKGQFQMAKDQLISFLARGSKPVEDVLKHLASYGISESTVRRAKKELGIIDRKNPDDGYKSYWGLPAAIQDEDQTI